MEGGMDGIRKAMNTGSGNQHESFHSKYNFKIQPFLSLADF